jgi:glycosyltransferase involved in cell wall biosynthesis
VSVAIPAKNEEHSLPALLESLLLQKRAPDEIIVVDGGSTDATVQVAQSYREKGVRVIPIGPAFPGRGRNSAIRAARHDWVAMIDAGCVAGPDWLSCMAAQIEATNTNPQIVFGNYFPLIETEWSVAQALVVVPPIDPHTGCRPPSIASALIHRSAWEAAGEFPEHLRAAEDLVFFERLAAAGVVITRAPGAVVHWSLPPTLGAAYQRLKLYSQHHLASGLARTWHLRVWLMHCLGATLALSAIWWRPALALLVGGFILRLFKTVVRRRGNIPSGALLPSRLARAAVVLLLTDVAVWTGLVSLIRSRSSSAR